MKTRRFLLAILSVAVMLSVMGICVLADGEITGTDKDVTWTLIPNTDTAPTDAAAAASEPVYYTLVLSGDGATNDYSSASNTPWNAALIAIDQYSTSTVRGTGSQKFGNITKIVVEDGVDYVGSHAFACTLVQDIALGTVTGIGGAAFAWTNWLETIEIPSTLQSMSKALETNKFWNPFSETYYLKSFTVEEGSTSYKVDNGCLLADLGNGWTILKCPALLDGVTAISKADFTEANITDVTIEAFHACRELTQIELPDSITTIGRDAFMRCTKLESFRFPDGVTVADTRFGRCAALKAIHFNNVRTIADVAMTYSMLGGEAFLAIGDSSDEHATATHVTELDLSNVTYIGQYAFYGYVSWNLNKLTSVTFNTTEPVYIGYGAFSGNGIACPDFTQLAEGSKISRWAFYGTSGFSFDNVLNNRPTQPDATNSQVAITDADGNVIEYYFDLLDALEDGKEYIKLLQDVTLSGDFTIYGHQVLDLNGHILNALDGYNMGRLHFFIANGATFEINDSNPTAVHKYYVDDTKGGIYVVDDVNGTETIYGGIITGGREWNTRGSMQINNGGKLIINGGNIIGNRADNTSGCRTIAGATASNLIINDGVVLGNVYGTGTVDNAYITDRDFAAATIYSGTFDYDVSAYLAADTALIDNGDGTYTVRSTNTVATVSYNGYEVNYSSLADALAAVLASDETDITLTLVNDIDLTGWTSVYFNKGITFVFDGNGKTISNLTAPLFSDINYGNTENVTIKNLTFSNVNIETSDEAAAVVGWHEAHASDDVLTIDNVHVTGGTITSTGSYAAGLVGYTSTTGAITITNSSVKNTVMTGANSTGSIVGHAQGITIDNCTVANNTINTTDSNKAKVGVVAGTVNGTQKISVTEESASTTTTEGATLNVLGRAYNSTEITGGSYFTDPTVASYTNDTTVIVPTVGFKIEADTTGMYGFVSAAEVGEGYTAEKDGRVTIFGETEYADPENSLYIELYSGDTYLGKTTLNDVDGIYGLTTSSLTWHFDVAGECTDTYWTTEWEIAPCDSYQPTKVVMYVDGVKTSENTVNMYSPDALSPVVWADLTGVSRRTFTVVADKTTVVAGDVVIVKVFLNGNGLNAAEWELTYDATLFELDENESDELYGMTMVVDPISSTEALATYYFTAKAQATKAEGTFGLSTANALTFDEADDPDVDGKADVTKATVTIELDILAVTAAVNATDVTEKTEYEVDYTANAYTFKVATEPTDATVTATVNGEAQTLSGNSFALTNAGTYEIKYTVNKLGYATVEKTITLTIGAPDYVVEVVEKDYVAGKKLILVYTNSEVISFTYNGNTMYDVTYKGYTYDNTSYAKVYGIVVDAVDGADYAENVDLVYAELDTAYVITAPTVDYDLNRNGKLDLGDPTAAFGVYKAYESYFKNNMVLVLTADFDNDKDVDGEDTTAATAAYQKTK